MITDLLDPGFGPGTRMSIREMKACLHFLLKNFKDARMYLEPYIRQYPNDPSLITFKITKDHIANSKLNDSILSVMRSSTSDNESKVKFIKNLVDAGKVLSLPDSSFLWLNNSDRACYWLWLSLKYSELNILTPADVSGYDCYSISVAFSLLTENESFPDSEKRREFIIECFDSVPIPAESKIQLLNGLKNAWDNFLKQQPSIKWVDQKNNEMCGWVWEHTRKNKYFCEFVNKYLFSSYIESEPYLSFIATLDLTPISYEAKKLFLIDAKGAWNQKKFKEVQKKNNRKTINMYIADDVKEKLKVIAKRRGIKMNDVVEMLISKEFDFISNAENKK